MAQNLSKKRSINDLVEEDFRRVDEVFSALKRNRDQYNSLWIDLVRAIGDLRNDIDILRHRQDFTESSRDGRQGTDYESIPVSKPQFSGKSFNPPSFSEERIKRPTTPLPRVPSQVSYGNQSPSSGYKFIEDYNAIERLPGASYERKSSQDRYYKIHQVTGFTCTNYLFRMNHPATTPTYGTDESQARASFWAIHLRNQRYAVVPNPKNGYESQLHDVGGMKEAFDSNFRGGSCSRIIVESPAIFSRSGDQWTVERKGKLILS